MGAKDKMNITFLIGNGFDINLGLNTRYSDFYPYFMEKSSKTNMIRNWLKKDELLWADLEERLGESLENVREEEQEQLYEDKAELEGLLLDYLGDEQKRFSTNNKEKEIADEFARSMNTFYSNLPEEGRNSITETLNRYKNEQFTYQFINFNYTSTLDQLVDIIHKFESPIITYQGYTGVRNDLVGMVLHIHGTLDAEMILGVNDSEQVKSSFLKNDAEFLDTFIKVRMNSNIGQRKEEYAKEILAASHIICIFGMSMGNTDKMWWEEIVTWLNASDVNKLLIYYRGYEKELNRKLPGRIIRLNKKLKTEIIKKGGIDIKDAKADKIMKRIFISYNANIFNYGEMGLVCPF